MSNATALLGQKNDNSDANPKKSKDEEDLQERSTKKMKGGHEEGRLSSAQPNETTEGVHSKVAEEVGGRSYCDMVLGRKGGYGSGEEEDDNEIGEKEGEDGGNMKVEERMDGNYACPEFVFSKLEEKRIYRPWRRGVIVKLLGRRIGYKALETRLKQMWVKKGVISIIDLGNDYYLVAFTHEDDQYAALMDGPWFIYDHYLTVKEWCPNFHPESDTIEEVAVWVRISGLPIEYYDSKVLNFIGNRVGKTVKVDKNTLMQERGKYARLCVQVDLTKPLLAMFTIKGRKYNIEYEGLHMLCLTCGKFGHYKEGCPDKGRSNEAQQGEGRMNTDGEAQPSAMGGNGDEGPWRVVHKQRRNRKSASAKNVTAMDGKGSNIPAKQHPAPMRNNGEAKISGSRFIALSDDNCEISVEDVEREGVNMLNDRDIDVLNDGQRNLNGVNAKNNKNRRGSYGGSAKKGEANTEILSKDKKLATRGGVVKGKTASQVKKGVENLAEKMGVDWIENLKAQYDKPTSTSRERSKTEEVQKERSVNFEGELGSNQTTSLGRVDANLINAPRPPNTGGAQKSTPILIRHEAEVGVEMEIFEDANDQGSMGTIDSDMEVVHETPHLEQ
ncbi:hypothetical protein L195_g015844 [Trifolium pratense]|uniref:CCHC-type domain-containing protein n=1 Tax=Trifolium pratense TaxID=57577 RepID=A0A2K3MPH0_TRIPR|nr:hypothetical protein L195_g015844 [Trifolium pratense]